MKKVLYLSMLVILNFFMIQNMYSQMPGGSGIEPCDNGQNVDCEWVGPKFFFYKPNETSCPNCWLVVEYFTKGAEENQQNCDGIFALQIVRIYNYTTGMTGAQIIQCSNCLGSIGANRYDEAYVKLVQKYKNKIYLDNPTDMRIEQVGCRRVNSSLLDETGLDYVRFQKVIPVASITDFQASLFPNYNPSDITVGFEYTEFTENCNSICCCYELAVQFYQGNPYDPEVISISAILPCYTPPIGGNPNCEEGCSGECQDIRFQWTPAGGFNPNLKRSLNSNDIQGMIIQPNPNNGSFQLNFSSELNGQIKILIYNSASQLVKTFDLEKNSETIIESIDTKLNNGAYSVVIELEGNIIANSQFVINK